MLRHLNGIVLPNKGEIEFEPQSKKVKVVDINIRNHPAFSRGGSKQLIATELIEEGTCIGSYGGEIKYYEEDDEEDWNNWNPYQLYPAEKCNYYVDGEKIGNEMRYINDPKNIGKKEANVEFRQSKEKLGGSIVKTGKNKRKKKIIGGFYVCNVVALRDIQPEEEILVDYGAGYWDSFQTWYERKNPYVCPNCNYRTDDIHNFARHSHYKEKVLCGFCNSKFADYNCLRRHIRNRHENIEKTYNCNKCEFSSSTYDKLAYHKRCNHSDTIWKCLECNLILGSKHAVIRHKEAIHDKVKVKCNLCDKMFSKTTIDSHTKRVHEKKKDKVCEFCQMRFTFSKDLNQHIKAIHKKLHPFKCEKCDYTAAVKSAIKGHHKNIHETKCEQCNEDFPSNQEMKEHRKRVHMKSFECNLCNYTSHKKGNVKHHIMEFHENRYQIDCDQCGHRLNHWKYLKAHQDKFHQGKRERENNQTGISFDIEVLIEDERSNKKKHRIDYGDDEYDE